MKYLGTLAKIGLLALNLSTQMAAAAPKASHSLNASSSNASTSTYRRSKVDLLLGAGINDVYGYWGMNFRIGAEFRLPNKPILLGAETGLMFGFGGAGVPFLGTATYELSDLSSKNFQARFGVSFGPLVHIGHGYYSWYYRYSDYNSVSLLMLTRPGGQIRLADNMALNVELVVGGTLSGMFILSPEATLVVKL